MDDEVMKQFRDACRKMSDAFVRMATEVARVARWIGHAAILLQGRDHKGGPIHEGPAPVDDLYILWAAGTDHIDEKELAARWSINRSVLVMLAKEARN